MQWFRNWFSSDAAATLIVFFLSFAGTLLYRARSRQNKRGNYVVCRQISLISHFRLSERARELVIVKYVGENQRDNQPISDLSQTIIDISNESESDVLFNIELEFHVLTARVLSVEWSAAVPDFLAKQSKPSFQKMIDESSAGEKGPAPNYIYSPRSNSSTATLSEI